MINTDLTVPIEGVKVEIIGNLLVVRSEHPLKTFEFSSS